MKCDTNCDFLVPFCEHALDDPQQVWISKHISECVFCSQKIRDIERTFSQLESFRDIEKTIHVHPSFLVRVNNAIDEQLERSFLPLSPSPRFFRWISFAASSVLVYCLLNPGFGTYPSSATDYETAVASLDSTQREQLLWEIEDPLFLPDLHLTTMLSENDSNQTSNVLDEELFDDLSFAELVEASSNYLSAYELYELLPSTENDN